MKDEKIKFQKTNMKNNFCRQIKKQVKSKQDAE